MKTDKYRNKVFWKTLGLLSHPFTLIAIAILFINDWFLRIYWPSWWTGKIGDFAWLFFFPLLLATILSVILPPKISKQEEIVRISAFLLTGLVFSLSNLFPTFNHLLNQALEALLRLPINIKRDPTDLLALTFLGIAWKFWEIEVDLRYPKVIPGLISFQFAIILTIANSPVQDYGIDSLAIDKNQIIAHSAYTKFISEDGGSTWERTEYSYPSDIEDVDNGKTNIEYDYTPGEIINVSKDGGESYLFEYSLSPTNQPLKLKYEMREGMPIFKQGPLDAVIDLSSGNIIFAMGHEGILLFTGDNIWEWISVGDYQRMTYNPKNEFYTLLFGEILMSLGFGFLVINTLTVSIHKGWFRKALVAIGWFLLFINITMLPPALYLNQSAPYNFLMSVSLYIIIIFGVILFLFLGILDLIKVIDYSKQAVRNILAVGLVGIIIFITPYLFWGFNIIPKYTTAAILASCTGVIMLFSVYMVMLNFINTLSKEIIDS